MSENTDEMVQEQHSPQNPPGLTGGRSGQLPFYVQKHRRTFWKTHTYLNTSTHLCTHMHVYLRKYTNTNINGQQMSFKVVECGERTSSISTRLSGGGHRM